MSDIIIKKEDEPIDDEINSSDPTDYSKLMEKYLAKFNIAYSRSQELWRAEKVQRQALYAYQRKVNALLELLGSYEEEPESENVSEDDARIFRLLADDTVSAKVKSILQPLIKLNDKTVIRNAHRVNMFVTESIPEVIGDEVDHLQINPQEPEAWARRHYPHLIVSKFKPGTVSSTFMQNTVEVQAPRPGTKRRRKADSSKDAPNEQDDEETGHAAKHHKK